MPRLSRPLRRLTAFRLDHCSILTIDRVSRGGSPCAGILRGFPSVRLDRGRSEPVRPTGREQAWPEQGRRDAQPPRPIPHSPLLARRGRAEAGRGCPPTQSTTGRLPQPLSARGEGRAAAGERLRTPPRQSITRTNVHSPSPRKERGARQRGEVRTLRAEVQS
jgi:hypothetical protein